MATKKKKSSFNLLEAFPGKKTYILAIGAVLASVGAFFNGDMLMGEMINNVWLAVGAMTLRKGVKGPS